MGGLDRVNHRFGANSPRASLKLDHFIIQSKHDPNTVRTLRGQSKPNWTPWRNPRTMDRSAAFGTVYDLPVT